MILPQSVMRLAASMLAWFVASSAAGQGDAGLSVLSLDSMEAFQSPGTNWSLASVVESDRTERWSLVPGAGTGVLVSLPDDHARTNLFTRWMHSDMELELEFMMPKGSNSGIYFQGRYEIQLLDSWEKSNPGFGDAGGIYQRWDEARGQGFEGHAPRVNASRAPGLWQSLRVVFRAPRFDAAGHKVQHARFELVVLNDAVLHQNVSVTGPTCAAAFADEAAQGPLMIQGDHGPVALRNIRYKRYGSEMITDSDVRYRLFVGDYTEVPLMELPTLEGRLDNLGAHRVEETQPLLVEYRGLINLPAGGWHRFSVALDWITGDPHFRDRRIGGAVLTVDDSEVLRHETNAAAVESKARLSAGTHPFAFVVHKSVAWRPPGVTLLVEGPDTPAHVLMQPSQRRQPVAPIRVSAESEPVILRGFVTHGGAKRTHAVSVGDPSGVHYSLDLASGTLLYVWRGPFLDVSAMWHNRGHDQLAKPQGSVLTLSGRSPLVWPGTEDSLQTRGYGLDADRRPVLVYELGDLTIEDRLAPARNSPYLWRTLSFTADGAPPEGLWVRAVSGASVRIIQEGVYDVDDRSFYIELLGDADVRSVGGEETLMLPIRFEGGAASVTYAIVW